MANSSTNRPITYSMGQQRGGDGNDVPIFEVKIPGNDNHSVIVRVEADEARELISILESGLEENNL